ncbi:alpha/beta-hydrolase [Meredithblackwellia eburnea MCA 4105]
MSDLPTLVFVPGAWHLPTCYDKISKPLHEQYGFKCVYVTNPSTQGDASKTFKDDLDSAQDGIRAETSQGRDVVVVCHSYGGLVGNSAVKGFTKPRDGTSRSEQPASVSSAKKGFVIGIVMIATGYNLTGLAFMDPFFGHPPPAWRIGETGFAELVQDPVEMFYHDVPKDEVDHWVSQLKPQSLKALFEGSEYVYSGWMDVPTWFIGTLEDRGLPVVAQRLAVGMAREMGGNIQHRELQTSHSPFLSQPDKVVAIMLEALAAFTGQEVAKTTSVVAKSTPVGVKLFQPLTWITFGLPLGFGHLIGRGVLIFGGARRIWRSIFSR